MDYPPLVHYATIDEYRVHFEQVYCQGQISAFDGIPIQFRATDFDHCFFESSQRNRVKDVFSALRSERIDWIKSTLQDPTSDLRVGWDATSKSYIKSRRVCSGAGRLRRYSEAEENQERAHRRRLRHRVCRGYAVYARGHQEEPKVDQIIKRKSRWFAKRAQRLKPL